MGAVRMVLVVLALVSCSDPLGPGADVAVPKPVAAGPFALAGLRRGQEAIVRYHSTGCYHDTKARLVFARGDDGVRVAGWARHAWSPETARVEERLLTADQVRDLDHELSVYRTVEQTGWCTTQTRYEVSIYQGTELVFRETLVDSSCVFFCVAREEQVRPSMALMMLGDEALQTLRGEP